MMVKTKTNKKTHQQPSSNWNGQQLVLIDTVSWEPFIIILVATIEWKNESLTLVSMQSSDKYLQTPTSVFLVLSP